MGNLLYINDHFDEEKKHIYKVLIYFLYILILGCDASFLLFGYFIEDKDQDSEYNFSYTSYALFIKIGVQLGTFTAIGFFALIVALSKNKNVADKLFTKKYFHYIIIIAIIDSITYLILYQLITKKNRAFIITEYFTSPIYLLYLIVYYYIFKKVTFSIKQIIISYILFFIGIILMIIGLTKYYCLTEKVGNGSVNYFNDLHLSIIISILLLPLFYFLKMFYGKKYMEITNNNALLINFKIYFVEFIIFSTVYLVTKNNTDIDYKKIHSTYMLWPTYAFTAVAYELYIFIILKQTNLFFIFIVLVFKEVIFPIYKTVNVGYHHYFLIATIITNIFGLITFSFFGDKNLLYAFKFPLYQEKIKENNSCLLQTNDNNNTPEDGKYLVNNNCVNDSTTINFTNGNDYLTPCGDNFGETNEIGNKTNMDEIQILKNENIRLKNENNELKSQNKNQNIQIQTLQSKIQNLEQTINNLSQKVAFLENK
jgi:hypothetical protein